MVGSLTKLLAALAVDLLWGEPPPVLHPVVWVGRAVTALERRAPKENASAELAYGGAMALMLGAASWLPARLLALRKESPGVLRVLVEVYLLKCSFAFRELWQAAERVRRSLSEGRLDKARDDLKHLVSRDTSELTKEQVASAAVESVAENLSDSFIAPLLYYRLFGVPGVLLYRTVNTMDAMIGYHGSYEYLGKVAARLDDVLNYIPARLAALLIALACFWTGENQAAARRVMLRDRGKTESPNAGWPMSAMAGALGVELEKVGHYRLGEASEPMSPGKINQAMKVAAVAGALGVALFTLSEVISDGNRS